jgi:hypothetical protein
MWDFIPIQHVVCYLCIGLRVSLRVVSRAWCEPVRGVNRRVVNRRVVSRRVVSQCAANIVPSWGVPFFFFSCHSKQAILGGFVQQGRSDKERLLFVNVLPMPQHDDFHVGQPDEG